MNPERNFTDSELIRKLKDNQEDAMIILYKSYWKVLYISAFKILQDKHACEDIIQELFIKIWNKRAELEIRSSIQSYLLAAVRYEVFRKIRESKNYEPIINDIIETVSDRSAYDILEYKELQARISGVIDTLPAKCKQVYMLSRIELLSHKEISSQLSISTKTVRNHLTKALEQLRISMNQVLLFLIFLFHLR